MTIKIENAITAADRLPTILWDNLLLNKTLTASTEAVDYPKENIRTENTNKSWRPTALPATLSVDLTASTAVDSFAIVGHNCGTKGNTILLQSSPDNSVWTTRATVVPTDDTTILGLFTSFSARYWRISISGGTVPTIAVWMLSQRFNMPAGVKPPYTPLWLAQDFDLLTGMTMGGQFLGNRVLRKGGRTAISLVALDTNFVETSLVLFRQHYNSGKAFVFASSPSTFTKDVGYVWRTESAVMSPTFDDNGNWMSVNMEVYSYGE
jgi:hypothetical protein